MADFGSALWNKPAAADSTPAEEPVTRSLRFDGSTSKLTRTPSSASSATACTISFWVKRGKTDEENTVFHAGTASGDRGHVRFNSNNTLEAACYDGSWFVLLKTNAVYRDPSAFYHIFVSIDTTNGTGKLFVNGEEPSLQTNTTTSSSTVLPFGKTIEHQIGQRGFDSTGYHDGLLADFYFIDGTALSTPVNQTISSTGYGSYKPLAFDMSSYSGNSFHLEFEDYGDHSLIGLDSSLGGAINWDTSKYRSGYGTPSWSENNTQFDGASGNVQHTMSNFAGSGKYYAEFEFTSGSYSSSSVSGVGPVPESWWTGSTLNSYMYSGTDAARKGCAIIAEEKIKSPTGSDIDCSNTGSEPHFTVGTDRIGIEVDGTANTAVFYRVNSSEKVEIGSLNNTDHGIDFGGKVAWGCTIHDANHSIRGYFTSASWLQTPSEGFAAMPSGNHFEATGISSHDIMLDTPTKNYCTLNPLDDRDTPLSEGNLRAGVGSTYSTTAGTFGMESGKWIWSTRVNGTGGGTPAPAMVPASKSYSGRNVWAGAAGEGWSYVLSTYSDLYYNNSVLVSNLFSASDEGEIAWAVDIDAGKAWIGTVSSGSVTWYNSGDPANGTNATFTFTAGTAMKPAISSYGSGSNASLNFGQDATYAGLESPSTTYADSNDNGSFGFQPPNGFLALCSDNLDAPTVTPEEHFDILTYTGNSDLYNGSGSGSTQNVTGVNFDVGMAWIKDRDNSSFGNTSSGSDEYGHYLFDTVTGTSSGGYNLDGDVVSSGSGAYLNSGYYGVTSFSAGSGTSRGITVDEAGETNYYYDDGYGSTYLERYVAWLWKLGSTGSSSTWNSSYTAPSTEHYNAEAGVTTIEVSPVSSGNLEVAHSLSAAPEFFFVGTDSYGYFSGYPAFHKDLDSGKYLQLDGTSGQSTSSNYFPSGAAHADYIKLGSVFADPDGYGNNLRIWAFTGVENFSKFGTYRGAGSSGVFVYTGHRPKMVWIKNIDTTGNWFIFDSVRDTYNETVNYLQANSSTSETTNSGYKIDILSNGFKINVESTHMNNSSYDYVFCSFAESPFKHANAR